MDSVWKLIDEKCLLANEKSFNFYDGVNVYVTRPHIVNQKVSAIDIYAGYTNVSVNNKLLEHLEKDFDVQEIETVLINEGALCETQELPACNERIDDANMNKNRLIFRNLIPRQLNIFPEVLEVVVLNLEEVSVSFYPKRSDVLKSRITPAFPYKITYLKNSCSVKLEILQLSSEVPRLIESVLWLKSKVFPKIIKWCQETPKNPILPSIKLLSAKDYNVNLHYLKSKYAEKFVKIWPEYNNTNPTKYVYEDIAIAAYLITLWNQEREELQLSRKQTFVDLGCGNGLLDHILSSEGHEGVGIDLRRRKIWDAYGPGTNLIEKVIEPNDKQRYPGYDWIIGNHADELTPWIPVIASRSSYDMKVFLLPCCFFTFDGKYERIHHKETQYQSYLKFLISLCTSMGFHAEMDKLRIPSTKRTCIVCTRRNYIKEMEPEIDKQRKRFIGCNLKGPKFSPNNENYFKISTWTGNEPTEEKPVTTWVPNFIPRESVEKVQNCSKLNKEIINSIIKKIFNHLLLINSTVAVQSEVETIYWNQGGSLEMKELCSLLGPEMLKCMKAQNGGVQTFLRNHSFIFEGLFSYCLNGPKKNNGNHRIQHDPQLYYGDTLNEQLNYENYSSIMSVKDNKIRLKVPRNIKDSADDSIEVKAKHKKKQEKKQIGLRKRNCFFHFNHPQGCPLSPNECTFSHEVVER